MMSMTCQNVDFGRMRFDLIACSCSSNASSERLFAKSDVKSGRRNLRKGYGGRKLFCFRSGSSKRRVYSTKSPESFLNGMKIYLIVCYKYVN